ncbi:hypothetical protein D3C80_1594600 [compost metagenome]
MGVCGGEEDAKVGRHAHENQAGHSEARKKDLEIGAVESGMLGLDDEDVVVFGSEPFGDGGAANALAAGMGGDLPTIIGPAPEVVVDVDDRSARPASGGLQLNNSVAHGLSLVEHGGGAFKLKIIDHVDDQKGDAVPGRVRFLLHAFLLPHPSAAAL